MESTRWGWFMLWGILLVALGIFAIGAATLTTFVTVMVLAALLLIGGLIILVDALSCWRHKGGAFLLHLLMGLLYIIAGAFLFSHPLAGSVSLTFILGRKTQWDRKSGTGRTSA